MRKSTPRHWLHAVLDLLPVLLIPVFMIYSHRHDMTEQKEVDIQYKYQSNEVNSYEDLIEGNSYLFEYMYVDNNLNVDTTISYLTRDFIQFYEEGFENTRDTLTIENGLYSSRTNLNNGTSGSFSILTFYTTTNNNNTIVFTFNDAIRTLDSNAYIEHNYLVNTGNIKTIYIKGIYTYKTTFRALDSEGNEINNINKYLSKIPLEYNVIESVEVNDIKSSVMNVFMDDFNTAINKYFNLGNVFGLNDVYQWFNTNLFSGNAPVLVYSIYNIIVYELVMDLLFLLYGLFMWFIDMLKALIEKPIRSIK